jgi:carboxylesterase type B
VLFHIHGGAFVSGAGEFYDPLYFMDECIVYISINYRLGALGFLTTNDGVIPGNLGLKDALLALKWTNQNIEHFRGNKDLVTITGISAGAMAASHFMASPAAKGLFHGVIAQSGSSLTPLKQRDPNIMSDQRGSLRSADAQSGPSLAPFIQADPKTNALRLGQLLGCMDKESKALKACLESKSIEEIISNQKKIRNWIVDPIRFFPVVEPEDATEPFQTQEPYLRIKRGEGSRVPLITGVMKDEGILMNGYPTLGNPAAVEELNNNWYEIAPIIYLYDHLKITVEERNKISDKIKEFYLGGKPLGPETAQGFIDSESDRYFNLGSWEEASLHSKYAPVYRYSMNFKSNYGLASQLFQLPEIAVSHADDIQYFYKSFDAIPPPEHESDRLRFSEMLIKLWVSFIKSGTPIDVLPNVEAWHSFTPKHPSTLILDFPAENVPDYKQERMEFWNSLKLRELEFPENENIII